MALSGRERSLELVEGLLRESAADETEVVHEHAVERFARFAVGGVTQSADRERGEISVRVRLAAPGGLREARAVVVGSTLEAGRRALARALELARLQPVNPALVELGGPVDVRETRAPQATLDYPFEELARWAGRALDLCEKDMEPAGLLQATAISKALGTSRGRRVHGETARFGASLTVTGGGGAGAAQGTASSPAEVDVESLFQEALRVARASREPREIAPGEYPVVLLPPAVSSILLFSAYQGFGAREVEEQSSFLCGREGRRVFSERFSLVDDPENPWMPALAFDGEGTPKRRLVLVDRGVPTGPVTDRHYAARRGGVSTGHGLPQPSNSGPMPQNLVVLPGTKSLDELIAGVDRGLLVSQFHYTNAIDPKELLLTGMTRNGTFWIENGRVKHPVKNLRFTQSLLEALADVREVGERGAVAGALFDGEVFTPPLSIGRFRFTSTTDF